MAWKPSLFTQQWMDTWFSSGKVKGSGREGWAPLSMIPCPRHSEPLTSSLPLRPTGYGTFTFFTYFFKGLVFFWEDFFSAFDFAESTPCWTPRLLLLLFCRDNLTLSEKLVFLPGLADVYFVCSSPPLCWGWRSWCFGTSPFVQEFSALFRAVCPGGIIHQLIEVYLWFRVCLRWGLTCCWVTTVIFRILLNPQNFSIMYKCMFLFSFGL